MTGYKGKNFDMANKGKGFENEINVVNRHYKIIGKALVQKISTPWQVVRVGKRIVSAFPEEKSTLDFRGTVKGGISISFDCKESEDERGLPLAYIKSHQVEYMRYAIGVNEKTFILCLMKTIKKRFYIDGDTVITYWDRWQENKGRRGFNYIPLNEMKEVEFDKDGYLDYLKVLELRRS
ncbi:recombination protein U [Clostridium amylolyticum]|uniref:Holliday junction resolvase RecU n=1 Tax=Clostridium amylolyticum TaxID=1121298 RepID=A0A1M6L1L6_9CLOT|nr:Holliday junction resolvase RecU [Clostridium amylolyticum]SHJ65120.1 recombination protein U [Clostridium amylolyticum]